MEEAKDCWLVIYPSKRTSGGRGSRSTLLSQYSEDKFLCNVHPTLLEGQENKRTVRQYGISECSPESLFDEESLRYSRSYFPSIKMFSTVSISFFRGRDNLMFV